MKRPLPHSLSNPGKLLLNLVLCLSVLAGAAQSQTSDPGAQAPADSWRATVATEREKLGGPYKVRPHRKLGDETPLSRECYMRLLKYVRLTEPRFHDWPAAPGCRFHKRDDHSEHGVRQNTTVALGYSALLAGKWVNGAMGLVYPSDAPKDSTWFISPFERGLVGYIVCEGVADSSPVVQEHRVETQQDSFAVGARISRCRNKVEQTVAVVSLPGAPVVYIERLTAREPVNVKEIATGSAGILNEDAPGISPNRRILYHSKGSEVIPGACSEPERLLRFDTPWANVDERLGVVASSSAVAYRDANAYAHSRLEEVLIGNYKAKLGPVAAGPQIDTSAVVLAPNQTHDVTAATRFEFVQVGTSISAVRFQETIIAANLGSEAAQGEVFGIPNVALEPLQVRIIQPGR